MRQTLIPTLLLAPLCLAQHPSQQLEVTAVRFWTFAEVTRIAIETNGEFRFRSDRLNNPDRLFFDVLSTKPRMAAKGVHTTPVGDKLLKRIRIAETHPGMTRVVLDLESSVEFTASQLSNPDRLMIELRPAAPAGSRAISSVRTPAPERPKPSEPETQVMAIAAVIERPAVEEKPAPPGPPPAP